VNDDARNDELRGFLEEDLGRGDITSEALIAESVQAVGRVHGGERAVLAGVEEAGIMASLMGLRATAHVGDGEEIGAGGAVLDLEGGARAILGIERTLLNLLSHMSGVASLTRQAVRAVQKAHTGARAAHPPRIAATRKTLPGLRRLQKKAVVLGGGIPHRRDLSAAVLVKDNHLALSPDLAEVMRRLRAHTETAVEIEVESLDAALSAAKLGADSLLLDNLDPPAVTAIVEALHTAGLRDAVSLEASGGITLASVHEFADTGVDVISMGILTSSAPHIDFSLHFEI
jgi:nicotinate-nucleotide pyrophosphorylase (carboxylating)